MLCFCENWVKCWQNTQPIIYFSINIIYWACSCYLFRFSLMWQLHIYKKGQETKDRMWTGQETEPLWHEEREILIINYFLTWKLPGPLRVLTQKGSELASCPLLSMGLSSASAGSHSCPILAFVKTSAGNMWKVPILVSIRSFPFLLSGFPCTAPHSTPPLHEELGKMCTARPMLSLVLPLLDLASSSHLCPLTEGNSLLSRISI